MNRFTTVLFSAVTVLTTAGVSNAAVYEPDMLGVVNGISANGKYAVCSDEDNSIAYLWQIDNPDQWVNITPRSEENDGLPVAQQRIGAEAFGVTDDGLVVGYVLYGDHTKHPAIWKDGQWSDLQMHPAARNNNSAVTVTADGSVIGGYMFINDPDSGVPGHYYPCRWVRDDEGEYNLTSYTDIELPDHQGFFPTCMSPDGNILAGFVFCGVGSYVPAMINADGEFTIFADIETKKEPFFWNGKYETRDENGKQGWTTDPNDPNIVYYDETYIDGVKDDNTHPWVGRFNNFDWSGHIYGTRTLAKDIKEDGTATLYEVASYYDIATDEWHNNDAYSVYSGGLDLKYIFTGGTNLLIDGEKSTLSTAFGVKTSRLTASVNCTSQSGQVLGLMTMAMNEAIGEYEFYPVIAVLDEPLVEVGSAVKPILSDNNNVNISADDGRIAVSGAQRVMIYDMQGRLVTTQSQAAVEKGIYIVKADNTTFKVMVK